ncbi:MAG: amidohydrolase family protein [Acidobacteria bacterium]|nr:amidohydrolase family protein [Acidobacteriota bacterium]
MSRYDLIVKNGTLVVPYTGIFAADLGVKNGRIASISSDLSSTEGDRILDAAGRMIFPGAVDSHYHVGIYRPLSSDAESESASSAVGGVTTIISYFRTGQHYLNRSGPYREIFLEVLAMSRGHFHTDYGYHIAVMTAEQLDEVEPLVEEQGVGSFKFYMFYKGLNLTADSTRGRDYTMSENYDLGHLYQLMERVAVMAGRHRERGRISLSLHCENPELIRIFIDQVKTSGLRGLEAYSRARPPLTERLSIYEATVLADATRCPINLLHLSSRLALEAAIETRRQYPHLDIQLETTLHHLALSYNTAGGVKGKVNPPIRTLEDAAFLWEGVLGGQVDTVVSDHACCFEEQKKEDDLWGSLPGFGGSSLLYPVLISEGFHRRRLPLTRIAELVAANPARNFGLYPRKGTLVVGSDADFAIVDLHKEQAVTPDLLNSSQDFTPFEGMRLKGWPTKTVLRGIVTFAQGEVAAGSPPGQFIKRPIGLHRGDNSRQ